MTSEHHGQHSVADADASICCCYNKFASHHNDFTHRSQRRKPWSQQDELNGIEEIGLSASVPTQNAVRCRCERVDFGLLPKGPKIGDCDLFDVHRCCGCDVVR
jgi:hypothetical protein